jgi:hypothetical protein
MTHTFGREITDTINAYHIKNEAIDVVMAVLSTLATVKVYKTALVSNRIKGLSKKLTKTKTLTSTTTTLSMLRTSAAIFRRVGIIA